MFETKLDQFRLVLEQDDLKIMRSAPIKSCQLDPVPAEAFKHVIGTLSPAITSIVNKSLQSGFIPDRLKGAMVLPLLKKPLLDTEELNNYRLVSNLIGGTI